MGNVAQLRESELEKEKTVLLRQIGELRGEIVKLTSEKASLHDVSTWLLHVTNIIVNFTLMYLLWFSSDTNQLVYMMYLHTD